MKNLFSKDNRSDLLVGITILVLLLISSNALSGFMPSSIVMAAIALFVAAFGLFAVLIWRETPSDEREAQIILSSDRLGFLVGAVILAIGIAVAGVQHDSTILPTLTLSGMVLAKLIGKYFNK